MLLGLDGLVAPLVSEGLHGGGITAADGLRDQLVAGGEEVVDLVEGVAVGAAHEAVADETDAELFLGHDVMSLSVAKGVPSGPGSAPDRRWNARIRQRAFGEVNPSPGHAACGPAQPATDCG
jgi:hypothetical protein